MVGILRLQPWAKDGADEQDRTADLVLTKDALCQLSYIGPRTHHSAESAFALRASARQTSCAGLPTRSSAQTSERSLERETGIEPATNSLEGCDSTTELLPPRGTARYHTSRAYRS